MTRRMHMGRQRQPIAPSHRPSFCILARLCVRPVMVAQLAPSLLRVCHRFSMLDGSNPDAEAEALPPPSGASTRHVRPPRVLSTRDVAALREEEATHLWQQVAAQLQGDWERIFEVSRR